MKIRRRSILNPFLAPPALPVEVLRHAPIYHWLDSSEDREAFCKLFTMSEWLPPSSSPAIHARSHSPAGPRNRDLPRTTLAVPFTKGERLPESAFYYIARGALVRRTRRHASNETTTTTTTTHAQSEWMASESALNPADWDELNYPWAYSKSYATGDGRT